jgi:hypothetical protein
MNIDGLFSVENEGELRSMWKQGRHYVPKEIPIVVIGCARCRRFVNPGAMLSNRDWKKVPKRWHKEILCSRCMSKLLGGKESDYPFGRVLKRLPK